MQNEMNAQQARELTNQNLHIPNIEPILNHVIGKIRDAAAKGCSSVTHPLYGFKGWPTKDAPQLLEILWAELRKRGFNVDHRPNPDPGCPYSRPYTVIAW